MKPNPLKPIEEQIQSLYVIVQEQNNQINNLTNCISKLGVAFELLLKNAKVEAINDTQKIM